MQSAKVMLDSGRYFFVVFMCHLTIEKLLKSVIVERQGLEPPRMHNLFGLIARAGLTIPAERRCLINELDNMSVVTRYPRWAAGNREHVDHREHNRTLRKDSGVRIMVKTRTDLIASIRHYAGELERLGVPVERIILYGSHQRGEAHEDSDIDLAVFSEAFGPPHHLEFLGVLSEAKWMTESMIEAIGFHPSVLEHINPISFLHEIVSTGEVVYQHILPGDSPHP